MMDKIDFGSYLQVMLIYYTCVTILPLGLSRSMFFFLPKFDRQRKKIFIYQSFILLSCAGLFFGSILYISADTISGTLNNALIADGLRIVSTGLIFSLPLQTLTPILFCEDKHKLSVILNLINVVLTVLSIMLPVLFNLSMNIVYGFFVCSFCIQFIILLAIISYLFRGLHAFRHDTNLMKEQFRFSFHISASEIAGTFSAQIDKFFVSFYFLPELFAIYAIGAKEIPFVGLITYSVSDVLQPKFVELHHANRKTELLELWKEAARKTSVVIFPIFSFLMVIANIFIQFLYTESYHESAFIFRLFLILLLFRITTYGPLLLALGFPKIVSLAAIGGLAINIIFNFVGIKFFSYYGAAIGTVLSGILVIIFMFLTIRNKLQVGFSELLPWRKLGLTFFIAVISGLLITPLLLLPLNNLLVLTFAGITYLVSYLLLGVTTRVLTQDDISLLKHWIRFKTI